MKPLLALLLLTIPAGAQTPQCFPYSLFRDSLKARFHEEFIGGGIAGGPVIVQVFASAGGATYSILAVDTSTNRACMIAAGKDWKPGKLTEKGEPS